MNELRIYLASSYSNVWQEKLVVTLRLSGFDVFDFHWPYSEPNRGPEGFSWQSVDENWESWDQKRFLSEIKKERALSQYALDMLALRGCHVCVLLLPAGNSAHLELGYAVGHGKHTLVYIPEGVDVRPDLMYNMTSSIITSEAALIAELKSIEVLNAKKEEG